MTAERQDDAGREARDQNDSQDRRGPANTANALGPREAVRSSLELAREKGPAQVRADECRNEVEAEREVAQDPDPEGPFGESRLQVFGSTEKFGTHVSIPSSRRVRCANEARSAIATARAAATTSRAMSMIR